MTSPRANKELGQHYLKDQKAIQTICSDFDSNADIIVEVGPGPISLTKTLSTKSQPLFVIEKDERFRDLLLSCVKEENIHFADALNFDWQSFLNENKISDKKTWLVSNLPYNVSVPLLISFIKIPQIKFMTLMFQKEVGDKTYVRQDTKNQMSSLLAICENYFHTKSLLKVAPGAFNPPPKVNSIVVSYKRRMDPIVPLSEFAQYEWFLRNIFQFKRKQLGKILKSFTPPESVEPMLASAAVPSNIRAESLEMSEVYALYKFHSSLSK